MDFEIPFKKGGYVPKPAPPPEPTADKLLETLPEPKDYPYVPFDALKVSVEHVRNDLDYKALRQVLDEALMQAAVGKGKDRHAKGLPFQEQRMLGISRLLDSERGMAYQACKKIAEGLDLPSTDCKVAELLGAINYIAGIVIFLREKDEERGDQ